MNLKLASRSLGLCFNFSSLYSTELVSQYQSALKKSEEAGKERQEHMSMMSSPATLAKRKLMQEKETELRTIERQLGTYSRTREVF